MTAYDDEAGGLSNRLWTRVATRSDTQPRQPADGSPLVLALIV